MNGVNRGALVAVTGAMALQLGLTDAMLHFLRPGMRPYLVTAGAVLLMLGMAVALASWRRLRVRPSGHVDTTDPTNGHGHEHAHGSRVAWLLLLPVCVGVLAPSALDSYSAARATPYQQRQYPLRDFDVERFLRSEAIAGGQPELPLSDYIGASRRVSNVNYLATHDVRVLGFVTLSDDTRGGPRFVLTRFRIGCCAADAIPMQLEVLVPARARIPAKDHWVEVTLRLVNPQPRRAPITVVRATELRPVGKPDKPYDYF